MRIITEEACRAFHNGYDFKRDNTRVEKCGEATYMYLHDNLIAKRNPEGVFICDGGGWQTSTTKERLNGISGVYIHQSNFKWYLNDEEWDGEWVKV